MTGISSVVVPITGAELARARQYLYGGLAWGVGAEVWTLVLLAFAYYSGASAAVAAGLRRWTPRRWAVDSGVTAALMIYGLIGLLPFSFYVDFVRERRFGFEHLGTAAWLAEWAESSVVTVITAVVVATIAYAWVGRRPSEAQRRLGALGPPSRRQHKRDARLGRAGARANYWWLKLWVVMAAAVVVAVAVEPVVIEPLFNDFTPVRNAALRTDIEALARRAGIPHAHIYEMDASRQSAHTNAYVVGILGSQRIVLYDTMIARQPPAEIEFVVGHEIGHYVLHHLWKGVGFTVALLLGWFAIMGWIFPRLSRGESGADVAALPLVLLILVTLVYLSAPVTNGFSRWEEHQADAYGLRLTPAPCAAVASFVREERTDLIYPDPPGWMVEWFFNHPDQQERINFASQACLAARPQ
ncbi:MAG TPA: M48 family metalloprotease [Terriglobales bacterium]|nr:M48 family metalloprotease [Terriglobales bacterium]